MERLVQGLRTPPKSCGFSRGLPTSGPSLTSRFTFLFPSKVNKGLNPFTKVPVARSRTLVSKPPDQNVWADQAAVDVLPPTTSHPAVSRTPSPRKLESPNKPANVVIKKRDFESEEEDGVDVPEKRRKVDKIRYRDAADAVLRKALDDRKEAMEELERQEILTRAKDTELAQLKEQLVAFENENRDLKTCLSNRELDIEGLHRERAQLISRNVTAKKLISQFLDQMNETLGE